MMTLSDMTASRDRWKKAAEERETILKSVEAQLREVIAKIEAGPTMDQVVRAMLAYDVALASSNGSILARADAMRAALIAGQS